MMRIYFYGKINALILKKFNYNLNLNLKFNNLKLGNLLS